MVLNIVNKFDKILTKITQFRDKLDHNCHFSLTKCNNSYRPDTIIAGEFSWTKGKNS